VPLLFAEQGYPAPLIENPWARAASAQSSRIESVSSLGAAVMDRLGSTILPASVAPAASSFAGADIRRLVAR